MSIPDFIKETTTKIRHSVIGGEITNTIADGIEKIAGVAQDSTDTTKDIEEYIKAVELEWDSDPNKDPEVLEARGGQPRLKDRFENTDRQLAQTELELSETQENLKNKMEIEYKKTFDFSRIPLDANGEYNYNNSAYVQDNLTTFNGHQYAVFVGQDRKSFVAKRKLPDGNWTIRDLSTVSGNPLSSPIEGNLHNTLSIAVDDDGFIHIAGNMHADSLRYIKSSSPESISAFSSATMSGINEERVTYPQFVKNRKNGNLLFFYREGNAISGKIHINRYNKAAKTWSKAQAIFIDSNSESVYMNHIAVDREGTIHVMYIFRSGSLNANNDICYAKSDDDGVTWKKSNGSNYTLPITHDTSELAVDTPTTGSGLINQSGLEADDKGNPHGAFLMFDSSGNTQIYHVWHDGYAWHNDKATNFSFAIDTSLSLLQYQISRPSVATSENGGVFIIYRMNKNGLRGAIRIIDVTPGRQRRDTELIKIDFHDAEPIFDTSALYHRNELSMLLIPSRGNGWQSLDYEGFKNWNNQLTGVYSFDLDQADLIMRQLYKVPTIVERNTFVGVPTGNIEWSNTSEGDLPIGGALLGNNYKELGETLFVKLKMRAIIAGGTDGEVNFSVHEQGVSTADRIRYGNVSVKKADLARFYQSPWLVTRTESPDGAFVNTSARAVSGTARVTLLEVVVGVLDY